MDQTIIKNEEYNNCVQLYMVIVLQGMVGQGRLFFVLTGVEWVNCLFLFPLVLGKM